MKEDWHFTLQAIALMIGVSLAFGILGLCIEYGSKMHH